MAHGTTGRIVLSEPKGSQHSTQQPWSSHGPSPTKVRSYKVEPRHLSLHHSALSYRMSDYMTKVWAKYDFLNPKLGCQPGFQWAALGDEALLRIQSCNSTWAAQLRHLDFKVMVSGDQTAHRSLHTSYTRHSSDRVNVILHGALILHPCFWCVAEKQPAWADQRPYPQTRHAILAHRHSYPWAATGAAGLPLQEVQHWQTGAVPQVPHCPWCCSKTSLLRSSAKAKRCKPRHMHLPCFFLRCWPTSSPAPPHWRPCRAPTSVLAVEITGRL